MEILLIFWPLALIQPIVGNHCPSESSVNLVGTSMLCPGDVGLYECTVFGANELAWDVNGNRLAFASFRPEGFRQPLESVSSVTFAYLLDIDTDSSGSNRTSSLHYEAEFEDTRSVDIMCDGGTPQMSCVMEVMVFGNEELQSLSIVRSTLENNGSVTYMWNNANSNELVKYMVIEMTDQTLYVNGDATQITLPISARGNISAVGFCEQRSPPVVLEPPSNSAVTSGQPVTTCTLVETTDFNNDVETGSSCVGPGIGGFFFGLVVGVIAAVVCLFFLWYCCIYLRKDRKTVPSPPPSPQKVGTTSLNNPKSPSDIKESQSS